MNTRTAQSHLNAPAANYAEGRYGLTPSKTHQSAERSAGMFSGQSYRGGVLVVDDEPDICKAVRMVLEKIGYYVVTAEDGEHAIRLLNEGEHPMVIDAIITDIRMPHINGIEAIEYFQREYPSLPLIVLTGFPDVELATRLLKRGVTDYLVKPVDREKLMASVAAAMNSRHLDWFA